MLYLTQPTFIMQSALKDYKKIAKDYNVSTHFIKDFSIDSGVRHFVEDHKIDLIGIANSFKHPIKRIFNGSNVEVIVNHSKVPVITISK